jgi:hypothetical protein
MTTTTVPTNARVVQYQNKFFREYIRGNRFSKAMGTDENSPIQLVEDLTKKRGEQVFMYLVNRLTGTGRTGYQTLKGHEEAMDTRSFPLKVALTRHAVTHWQTDEQFSAIDLVEAKNAVLKNWFMENIRDRIILALGSMSIDGATHFAYADADETSIKDVWLANNSDRVLFGAGVGSFTDHSADLSQLDTTNDIVTEANLKLLKDKAKTASPKIRPIKVREDEEWYLVYMGTKLFRQAQTALATLNREAWVRAQGESNPLFTGGDLICDGMIIKEIPEIGSLAGTPGASGTTAVAPAYLVGAQALGYGIALRSKVIEDTDDYGEVRGAGIKMVDVVRKAYFGTGADDTTTPKQHGVVTGYFAHA